MPSGRAPWEKILRSAQKWASVWQTLGVAYIPRDVRTPFPFSDIRHARQKRRPMQGPPMKQGADGKSAIPMNKPNDVEACRILAGIPPEDLRRDCPTARIVAIRHRGTVYRQGEPARAIYCVLDGHVTIARISHEGATLTTAALGAGDFFGPALSGADEAEDTARAKGAVCVWQAPIEEFRRLLLHHPDSALDFVSILARRQRQMERRLEGFAFKRVEARLAETFRELSGGFATRCEHGFGQHLRLSQQELADLVGASRPVVSTILNRLRDKGVLGYTREYVCVRGIEDIEILIDS